MSSGYGSSGRWIKTSVIPWPCKFDWHPEFDAVLDGMVVPTCENKFGWLSVNIAGPSNKNRLWRLAKDNGGPASENILCWSYDTSVWRWRQTWMNGWWFSITEW